MHGYQRLYVEMNRLLLIDKASKGNLLNATIDYSD